MKGIFLLSLQKHNFSVFLFLFNALEKCFPLNSYEYFVRKISHFIVHLSYTVNYISKIIAI